MEIILFTLVAIVLYLAADSILKAIEKRKGEPLANRNIVFFIIISVLALTTFNLLETYGPGLGLLPKPPVEETVPVN